MVILKKVVLPLLLLLLFLIPYTIYDNQRVVLKREVLKLERLPEAFHRFTILLISDLHEKRFGEGQERLLKIINGLDYHMLAIAGDMLNHETLDKRPFFEILEGLEKRDLIFFVKGNTDLEDYHFFTGEVTTFGRELQERGVTLLHQPYPLQRDGEVLWITSFQLYARIEQMLERAKEGSDGEYSPCENYWSSIKTFWQGVHKNEVKIALTHYPASDRLLEDLSFHENRIPDYDLILAGHYHGGQFRLPFIGAFYVPEAVEGWFPPSDIVCGLKEYHHYRQYISRGLGASKTLGFFNFRLFNPPEINLITLKADR